ncbi:MAG: histidine phosphatase family protein [Kiritimatiellia bacterium]|jgi:broad specificity phosphatase PhoE|nr:histidine phosphatase family protein [Kiritimatiellia bacterium]MDP6810883.1 histidine phosphatase family protein [Kiritimatiellia bacterium]MDP7023399.1 histidine phosphatase family protein [Kiritimatiellia bacterium]
MKLLIIRHAESEGNASGNYSIAQADSLSAKGEKQALRLADELASHPFHSIIVSPLQRALQTISPYLNTSRQQADIWPEIAEACWHDKREAPADDWFTHPASLPSNVNHQLFRYRDGQSVRPAHHETFGEGLCRVHRALERIEDAATRIKGTVLMVTHGHFIRELLNLMHSPPQLMDYPHDNCGITLVHLSDRWTTEFCNRQLLNAESNKALQGTLASSRAPESRRR